MEVKTDNSKIIVEGEASESDDDDITAGDETSTLPAQTEVPSDAESGGKVTKQDDVSAKTDPESVISDQTSGKSGVVVSGEASESDEEFEVVTHEGHILPLNVNKLEKGDSSEMTSPQTPPITMMQKEMKPKYNTLLNRKLRERNIALRRHIVDTVHQSYTQAAKDLHNLTVQIQKATVTMQDISFHMRSTTNDLFHLEDRVDIIRSCNILPDITFPSQPDPDKAIAQT